MSFFDRVANLWNGFWSLWISDKEKANPEAVYEAFGEYWTTYTAEAGYGELMRSAGKTLPEFLRNLDLLHTRVKMSFPHLVPPSFTVTDETADSLVLHYYSSRQGLAPLVVGLLRGLGDRFGVAVTVSQERVDHPTPHEVYHLSWKPKSQMPGS